MTHRELGELHLVIDDDGELKGEYDYVNGRTGEPRVEMDGSFTVAQLEAIISYMRDGVTPDEARK